ncbi:hypothetical protein EJ07DRAFT_154074 [Lizonia empirigonia]|nr:hypothetical protein EJ07DRAFT_154074 [Lizonia empirigonia]
MATGFSNTLMDTAAERVPRHPQFFEFLMVTTEKMRRDEATGAEMSQLIELLCDERMTQYRAITGEYVPELYFFVKLIPDEDQEYLYSAQMRCFGKTTYRMWMRPANYNVASYLSSIEKNQEAFRLMDSTVRKLRFGEATEHDIQGLSALICTHLTGTFRAYAEVTIPELCTLERDLINDDASPEMLRFVSITAEKLCNGAEAAQNTLI